MVRAHQPQDAVAAHAVTADVNLWIITLTADAREAQREQAHAEGGNDYLVKPLQLLDLELAFRRFGEAQEAAK